jgi:hypothetical protein
VRAGWQDHAYCLMGNHFHLVVETPQPMLVARMKWFLGTYTQRFNARHRLSGHLFAGRYKSLIVNCLDDIYLRVACEYVHLNPVRAGLVAAEDFLERLVEMGAGEKASRSSHEGEAVAETMEEMARDLIRNFFGKHKTDLGKLRARRNGGSAENRVGRGVKKRTTMTMGWIAQELNAGTPKNLWNARGKEERKAPGS